MSHQPGGTPASYTVNGSVATATTPVGTITPSGSITPTTITTLTLNPTVTGTALPVTFGHAFKSGDVPAGASVEVFGKTTQFDAKSTHVDGSVRHAILTTLTDTAAGVPIIATLRTRAPVGGTAISKADILASAFDASASLVVGGTTYTLTARDLLAGTVTPLLDLIHLSGPQCSEFIVGAKLRNGASPHAHLAAYFHVRAYGAAGAVTRVRCDVRVENGFVFAAGSGLITHNPTITVGGSVVYTSTAYASYHHTHFSATGWWGGDPQVRCAHHSAYLMASGAVPNYEAVTLKETLLASLNTTYVPGGLAGLRASWGDTGDHPQIGVLPEWDACYAVSGDVRALNASIAASRAGGSFSYHYRDENTGYPVSIDTYPTMDEQNYSAGLVQGTGGTAYTHDAAADASAHAPLLGYLAYLATGDYAHLEELHFHANYILLWRNSSARTYLTGPQDGIVGLQNRGQAWGIRTLGAAAAITPDTHALKSYFVNKLTNNINQKTTGWASPSKNIFGHVQDYNWPTKVTPFENDFFLTTFGWLVELGYASASTMRDWLSKSPPGRLGQNASGYCPHFATPYSWTAGISPTPTGDTFYATWTALYEANYPVESGSACPAGLIAGSYQNIPNSGDFTHGFYGNLKPALAMAVDAGVATLATWNQFTAYAANDYTYSPRYNVVPRALLARPAWYLAQTTSTWKEFTGLTAESVDPCNLRDCTYSGVEGFAALMDSWSGGIYDSKRNRHIFWGGGHNAYGGNEQVAWNLYTQTWERITQPSTSVSQDTTYYPDGKPSSRHTYNVLQYDHVRDQLISGNAGATFGVTGGAGPRCDAFSYASNTWAVKAPHSDFGSNASNYATFSAVGADATFWMHPDGFADLYKYDPGADTWTQYTCSYNYNNGAYCTAAIDTLRNRFVVIGGGHFTKTSLSTPTVTVAAGGSPPSGVLNATAPGWVYDPVGDRFIGWVGGQTLHTVDAATLLSWNTISIAGGGATPPSNNEGGYQWRGTNGKFRYAPDLHGLSLCVQTGLPPYFFKL